MNPEVVAALVVPVVVGGVLIVGMLSLFPSTRSALASWIRRRAALSDEAHAELSQIRYEIALLRNEVAELHETGPKSGVAIPTDATPGRLRGGE